MEQKAKSKGVGILDVLDIELFKEEKNISRIRFATNSSDAPKPTEI